MFDVAPTEMLLVAAVALVVIGPKDLPRAMHFVGKWVGKARGMARHFRSGLDAMVREAELEEMEKQWRKHNESIMRAYPDLSGAMTPIAPPAADQAPTDADPPATAVSQAPPAEPKSPETPV